MLRPHNRLRKEKSPYLQQHAENPVDWFPWGDEAFNRARSENKPVFLSIGYATCHWCHVMEKESFQDEEIAESLNRSFVSIKVDREERPDIDHLYMTVCQLMNGSGGWPLTIIMTPNKEPFFAATYLPKNSRYGRVGLTELLPKIDRLWREQRKALEKTTNSVMHALIASMPNPSSGSAGISEGQTAFKELNRTYDETYGGFGDKPKFPQPHWLLFLLRYWSRSKESRALEMVEHTLTRMKEGAIYDQIGSGFHRYSTDRTWRLPHFEKMLCDQALLIMAYIETFQATHKQRYADTARDIIIYVLRDLASKEGGFYTAEDADSNGEEGSYYLWTSDEITRTLGNDPLVLEAFDVQKNGNYREEASGAFTGKNVLYLKHPLASLARQQSRDETELTEYLNAARTVLFNTRSKRRRPARDDKIITDWNGLMIAALALAGRVLDEPRYIHAAEGAATFILKHLYQNEEELLHRYRNGHSAIPAFLDDYVFLAWGFIELYHATFRNKYIRIAGTLMKQAVKRFSAQDHGFYFSRDGSTDIVVRQKIFHDSALPCGNAVALHNLLKLWYITKDPFFRERAIELHKAFPNTADAPTAYLHFLSSLQWLEGPAHRVVLTGRTFDDIADFTRALRQRFLPFTTVIYQPSFPDPDPEKAVPDLRDSTDLTGKPVAIVCSDDRCHAPTADSDTMIDLLEAK
ncbi:MAG: thioredoxin domain-containing protein [candidate division WOR-3 bacterium]|nr:MAG: thioredoxin domain-containing protein [candidate division WOR-3 bacterium]